MLPESGKKLQNKKKQKTGEIQIQLTSWKNVIYNL